MMRHAALTAAAASTADPASAGLVKLVIGAAEFLTQAQ
jgi:hypothetical protein